MEYGLLGKRLSHSHSPMIHRELGEYEYILCPTPPKKVARFLTAKEFRGLNVTIPYKQTVIPYCDEIGPAARKIGAVNTIIRREDGTLFGDNTDYYGFLSSSEAAGISFAGKKVLILGSGGTSLTARAAVRDSGARELIVVSRAGTVNYKNVYDHTDAEIIVNTTPVGMYPDNGISPVDITRFPSLIGVMDVIYNPLKSALLLAAEERGIPHTGGLLMLVAQAKASAELFTGNKISDEKMLSVYKKVSSNLTNIILIGMPGCGKSRIGRELARKTGRKLVDTDARIRMKAKMPIPQIFEQLGEARFRELEAEVAAECGKRGGLIIATGGGIVVSERNKASLRQNGRVYFIRRPLSLLATKGRPLSKSPETLAAMAREREPKYLSFCDMSIVNDRKPHCAADRILEDFYEASCN